jgi:hypothetical protein
LKPNVLSKEQFSEMVEIRVQSDPDRSYISTLTELIGELEIEYNNINRYINEVIRQKVYAEGQRLNMFKTKHNTGDLSEFLS